MSASRSCVIALAGFVAGLVAASGAVFRAEGATPPFAQNRGDQVVRPKSYDEKLDTPIEHYEVAGQPFLDVLLDLSYRYKIPMGIEYLNRDAVRRPLTIKLAKGSARQVISATVAQLPEYAVDFS
jgi:hypothetical protein